MSAPRVRDVTIIMNDQVCWCTVAEYVAINPGYTNHDPVLPEHTSFSFMYLPAAPHFTQNVLGISQHFTLSLLIELCTKKPLNKSASYSHFSSFELSWIYQLVAHLNSQ
ncbi:hypothetical protein ILYODFUR_004951 [Ilyodon furcidens]|uniref:Uncharacterized protein n=1 Tax=Ilyodon furcidens TaxID=33524 RepID=A0ABV0SXD8_9TELE